MPPQFDLVTQPTVVSVTTRQELLCTDFTKSILHINNLSGKGSVLVKAKQDEYLYEGCLSLGSYDDRSALCIDHSYNINSLSIGSFNIVKLNFPI